MLELRNISKTYFGKYMNTEVLKGISIKIEQGEFALIIGKSGCGKSTLLNILGCMDCADEGDYIFMGQNLGILKDEQLAHFRNRNIGFVFQGFHLINEISIIENIEMPMGIAGIGKKVRRERALELLGLVGLGDKAKSRPLELSGGQQQRIAIARALSNHPNVLLCDEPTGNLDEESGRMIMELLAKLNRDGVTIIMVTHDLSMKGYANRVIEVKNGRVC